MWSSQKEYYAAENLKDMMLGLLNRIAVTDDPEEIGSCYLYLQEDLDKLYKMNQKRIADGGK